MHLTKVRHSPGTDRHLKVQGSRSRNETLCFVTCLVADRDFNSDGCNTLFDLSTKGAGGVNGEHEVCGTVPDLQWFVNSRQVEGICWWLFGWFVTEPVGSVNCDRRRDHAGGYRVVIDVETFRYLDSHD